MATAAVTASPAIDKVDERNLHWKSDNVGSKLLSKMGWRNGEAVGKRQREQGIEVTGQGLRATKRREGLGIGASSVLNNKDPQHVGDFGQVLAALQQEHGGSSSSKRKSRSKRSSPATVLPTNKTTHSGVRQAKFQEKTAEDLKCIFAGYDFPMIAAVGSEKSSKKRKEDRKDKKKRKKSKKEKKEA